MKHLSKEATLTLKKIIPNPGEIEIIDIPFADGEQRTATLSKEAFPSRMLNICLTEKSPDPSPHSFARLEFNVKCGTNFLSAALMKFKQGGEHMGKDGEIKRTWQGETGEDIDENSYEVSIDDAVEELELLLSEVRRHAKATDQGPQR